MIKNAVVTGSTGYIGSNLARKLLADNWNVILIVRENSSFSYLEDISNRFEIFIYKGNLDELIILFERIKPIIVFHLASLFLSTHCMGQVDDLINSNIRFGTHILEAMGRTNVTNFVNTGTSWQHYNNEAYNPVNLYAATKEAFAEGIMKYYQEIFKIRTITLELFDTYGEGDKRNKIINILRNMRKTQQELEMSQGEQELSFVYIDDVISAYLIAAKILMDKLTEHTNRTFTVKSNQIFTLKELVFLYESASGTNLKIKWGNRKYREREVMTLWDKGENLPYWEAKVSMKEGLDRIRRFDEKNGEFNETKNRTVTDASPVSCRKQ